MVTHRGIITLKTGVTAGSSRCIRCTVSRKVHAVCRVRLQARQVAQRRTVAR